MSFKGGWGGGGGGGGGKGANYGWGFRPAIRQAGGGGLIMVGGLVPRYDSGGGGRCTLQAQYERRGEEELLSRRGGRYLT